MSKTFVQNVHLLARGAGDEGGAQQYTRNLIKQLSRRGHRVTLFCYEASDDIPPFAEVIRLPLPDFKGRFGTWRFASCFRAGHCKRELRKISCEPADIVVASDPPMAWGYDQLFGKRPFIYVPHALLAPIEVASYAWKSNVQKQASVFAYRRLESWLLRRANATVRFTAQARELMRDAYDCDSSRMVVFPQAFSVSSSQERDSESKLEGPLRLLFVGRLVESKNVALAIDAVANCKRGTVCLDIVGDGPARNELETQVKSLELESFVSFHGHCGQTARFYDQSDLFVFPSRLENAPIVVLEAMGRGLPVLGIRHDGSGFVNSLHETIHHETNGYLCAGENGFLEAIEEFSRDAERDITSVRRRLRSVGKLAKSEVVVKHSWENHTRLYEDLFDRILQDSRSVT